MRNLLKVAAAALLIAAVAVTSLAASGSKQGNTAPIRSNGYSSGGGSSSSSSGGGGGTGFSGSVGSSTGIGPGGSLTASNAPESASVVTGHWDFDGANWHYIQDNGARISGQFAYLENPYAGGANQLFAFDAAGNMLKGWVWIKGANGLTYCYYFNPVSNGSLGAAQLGGTTPDGWQVNSAAQWTVEGVAQTK